VAERHAQRCEHRALRAPVVRRQRAEHEAAELRRMVVEHACGPPAGVSGVGRRPEQACDREGGAPGRLREPDMRRHSLCRSAGVPASGWASKYAAVMLQPRSRPPPAAHPSTCTQRRWRLVQRPHTHCPSCAGPAKHANGFRHACPQFCQQSSSGRAPPSVLQGTASYQPAVAGQHLPHRAHSADRERGLVLSTRWLSARPGCTTAWHAELLGHSSHTGVWQQRRDVSAALPWPHRGARWTLLPLTHSCGTWKRTSPRRQRPLTVRPGHTRCQKNAWSCACLRLAVARCAEEDEAVCDDTARLPDSKRQKLRKCLGMRRPARAWVRPGLPQGSTGQCCAQDDGSLSSRRPRPARRPRPKARRPRARRRARRPRLRLS